MRVCQVPAACNATPLPPLSGVLLLEPGEGAVAHRIDACALYSRRACKRALTVYRKKEGAFITIRQRNCSLSYGLRPYSLPPINSCVQDATTDNVQGLRAAEEDLRSLVAQLSRLTEPEEVSNGERGAL